MKSLWKKPGHGLAEPSAWTVVLGVLALAGGGYLLMSPAAPKLPGGTMPAALVWLVGSAYLAIGIGAWQERRPAVVAGSWVFLVFSVFQVVSMALGFAWTKLASVLLLVWISWDIEMRSNDGTRRVSVLPMRRKVMPTARTNAP